MYLEDIRGETQRIIGIKGGDYLLTAFVGTNSLRGSKGIYTVAIDEKTADMEIVNSFAAENSAYLCFDENHKHLYATIESDCVNSAVQHTNIFSIWCNLTAMNMRYI